MTSNASFDRAKPAGFIHFRQHHLLVVSHQSALNLETTEYVEAKPLVEATKFAWEAAHTLLKRNGVGPLCGKSELLPPDIATHTPLDQPNLPHVYLRLEDVLLFLALLSTDGLHEDIDQGAVTDSLILQDQWVNALRAYQRQAMAMRLWQRLGMDDVIYPEPKRPRAKPTMFQEIDLMREMSEHGGYSHSHHCCCQRQRNQQHGHY